MQILDMEQRTGLDRATIRFYEKEGLVVPRREGNGYRIYSNEDLQSLLRIKLLRQLGVSLFKIKSLHQGEGNFSQILNEQIQLLEKRIQEDRQAAFVCRQMQSAGVAYSSLDATFYLQLLQTPQQTINRTYQEPIPKESHPFRRFFARLIDVAILSTLIEFILIVVFRIRPFSDVAVTIIEILTPFIFVPIEAILLQSWGTTPGKWIMGIRLEHVNGGNLSFDSAFFRAAGVIKYGYGFFLPIWQVWRYYRSYTDGEDNPWNDETEIIYTDWTPRKKILGAVIVAVTAFVLVITVLDISMPQYRTENLTMAKFVENYQDYEKLLGYENYYTLQEDGTWELDYGKPITIIYDNSEHERLNFEYTLENGAVQSIHFHDTWENPHFLDSMPFYCRCAILALVGSRPGNWYNDVIKAENEINETFYAQFATNPEEGTYLGEFIVNDVQVAWEATLEDADTVYNGVIYSDENVDSSYTLRLTVKVVD